MREGGNPTARDDVFQRGRVAEMGFQQLRADFISDFGDVGIRLQLSNFKDKFAGERIAVGVQAGRREREQSVSGLDALAGQKIFALDGANDKAREIVFAGRIEAGHLRGFAADEGAAGFAAGEAHAFDELLDNLRIELAHREVVEEKERLRALDENVIDAVIHEVAADGGMNSHGHGDFEFCAYAVRAGDQHGLFPLFPVEREERAEAADAAEHAGSKGAAGVVADSLLRVVGDGDIDSGIGVFHVRVVRLRFCCGRTFARIVRDWEIIGAPGGPRRSLQSPTIPRDN